MSNELNNVIFNESRIIFRNFSGRESKFNRAGDRNFCVVIEDPIQAQYLLEQGWNLRPLANNKDPEAAPNFRLQISVSYKYRSPKIFLVTQKGLVELNEQTVSCLDDVDVKFADIEIRPSHWTTQNRDGSTDSGIKAYLNTMYVTIEEDVFADKYSQYNQ